MTVDLAKTPSSRLDGRRALVTGGGRGIGLAAASALAAAGAHVTLAARTEAEIEEAAAKPMPRPPPVTSARRPSRRNEGVFVSSMVIPGT